MTVLPGLAIAVAVAGTAALIAKLIAWPAIIVGFIIALSIGPWVRGERWEAGLDIAGRDGLRIGIAILGLQITAGQVLALGPGPFAGVVTVMVVTIAAAMLTARATQQSRSAGVLAGGATAICGSSAALALYGVIGRERLPHAQFVLTLVGVSAASALALTLYPSIARALALSDAQAGFLTGAAIHDVAQAIGGGFAVSNAAGEAATVVKLARVTLLAPLVAIVAFILPPAGDAPRGPWWRRIAPPWFITVFLALVLLNSLVPMPPPVAAMSLTVSKVLLLVAVTATALRTRLDLVLDIGWRAAMPVVAATLASFAAALTIAVLFV